MQNNRSLEIGTGLFVLLGFAALAFLTTQLPGTSLKLSSGDAGYRVTAAFDNILMKETFYLRPRMSSQVTCSDC